MGADDTKDENDQSVYTIVNRAKGMLVDAVGQVMNRTGLPPYIIDGILSSILSDIRQKELYDIGVITYTMEQELAEAQKETKKEDGDGGHHSGTGTDPER